MTWDYDEDWSEYRQCVLVREDTTRTTWLPAKFAAVGQVVGLREGEDWSSGWEVRSVGPETRTGEKLKYLNRQSIRAAGHGKDQPLPYARRQDWWMYD